MESEAFQFLCFVCMQVGAATIGAVMGVAIAATGWRLFTKISEWRFDRRQQQDTRHR